MKKSFSTLSAGKRRIAAPWGLSESGRLLKDVLLVMDGDGTLENAQYGVPDIDRMPCTERYNGILIPAMVNAHCHLELSSLKGYVPMNTGLPAFLDYMSPDRPPYSPDDAAVQDRLMWNEGVSAVGDISGTASTFPLKAASRIRYLTFAEYYGYGCRGDAEEYVRHKTGDVIEAARRYGLDAVPSPHSTYLVSEDALRSCGNAVPVCLHFMESLSEEGFFQGRGAMYGFVKTSRPSMRLPGYGSAADMLVGCFPPETRMTLVHCTTMTREDIDRVKDHFRDVTFVLCPRSNRYIEGTVPPADALYAAGCRVAIGTDSLASNTSLSMAEEILLLSREFPSIPLETLLVWATSSGAHALGYDDRMGYFREGFKSGALLAEGVDLKTMKPGDGFRIHRLV